MSTAPCPRTIAERFPRTADATAQFLGALDERAAGFTEIVRAVTEFVLSRETLERAACAALCREAECICYALSLLEESEYCMEQLKTFGFRGQLDYHNSPPTAIVHDPRCPDALASRIEARGAVAPTEKE